MPTPFFSRNELEIRFFYDIFSRADDHVIWQLPVRQQAEALAERHGLAAMAAIHIAIAINAQVDEFVSGEKPDKPMFRVTESPMRSLRGTTP